MKVLNLLISGNAGGIESLCNNIDKYSDIDNYWIFLCDGGIFANEIEKRNPKKVYRFNFKNYQLYKCVIKLSKICKEEHIDIVNIHHGGTYCNMLFYYLKKRNPNIKFVRTLHSCYEEKYFLNSIFLKNILRSYYYRKALQVSDLIISVSRAVQESHEKRFNIVDKKKIVIYNGISSQLINTPLKIRDSIQNRTCNIIYVGRLVKVKGVDLLIKAIAKLTNVHLTIVGTGNEEKKLKKLTEKMNITDKITFVGVQSNVIDWLDKSDIFVYPSVWEEAFGISVVEAMSRGCIPITFKRGGLPEIIEDGKNGYIVKETTSEALATKIKLVIKKMKEGTCIRPEDIKKRAEKFTIDDTIKKLKLEYDNIINKRSQK